jgi:hypothetical protein
MKRAIPTFLFALDIKKNNLDKFKMKIFETTKRIIDRMTVLAKRGVAFGKDCVIPNNWTESN